MPVTGASGDLESLLDRVSDEETRYLLLAAHNSLLWFGDKPPVIGLAVSGGSDSMAMLHLMARVAPALDRSLEVATVDHRLRPEAAAEAAFVAATCAGLGIAHEVLVWDDHPATGNLMQAASMGRYAALAAWAQRRGIGTVAVAHTADDQAETVLMGLSRAAGLDGLAGMRPVWAKGDITFRRPFLGLERAELRRFLTREGLEWRDDPSNDDPGYSRIKARRALKSLKPLGITAARLGTVAHNLAMSLHIVEAAVARAAAETLTETAGSLSFDRRGMALCEPEVWRRLLIAMIRWIGGGAHAPRESKILALSIALQMRKDATLAGVRFRWKDGLCTVSRESRAVSGLVVAADAVWDGRWRLALPETTATAQTEIRALGAAGLRQCPDWRATGLPRHVLEVTPGLWQGDILLAAPCAGFGAASAICAPSFAETLLSH